MATRRFLRLGKTKPAFKDPVSPPLLRLTSPVMQLIWVRDDGAVVYKGDPILHVHRHQDVDKSGVIYRESYEIETAIRKRAVTRDEMVEVLALFNATTAIFEESSSRSLVHPAHREKAEPPAPPPPPPKKVYLKKV